MGQSARPAVLFLKVQRCRADSYDFLGFHRVHLGLAWGRPGPQTGHIWPTEGPAGGLQVFSLEGELLYRFRCHTTGANSLKVAEDSYKLSSQGAVQFLKVPGNGYIF